MSRCETPGVRIVVARPLLFERLCGHHPRGSKVVCRMPQQYSTAFKSRMLRRLIGPDAVSANALAQEVGIGQTMLSRWLRESRTVEPMRTSKKKQWTGAEKLRVVLEARGLSETELGALLRREGLHESDLTGVASGGRSGAESGPPRGGVAGSSSAISVAFRSSSGSCGARKPRWPRRRRSWC